MVDEYLIQLIKQFKVANGFKGDDIESEEFWQHLENWIITNRNISEIYQDFLLRLGLFTMNMNCLELGKGCYDTIVSEDSRTSIATKYTSSFFNKKYLEKLVKGRLYINEDRVFSFLENAKKRSHECRMYNTVFTQNIYSESELEQMIDVHNSGNLMIVGAYGLLEDKNRVAKIEQLRSIKKELTNNYKEEYAYIDDKYVYCLYSNLNNKKKTLTR